MMRKAAHWLTFATAAALIALALQALPAPAAAPDAPAPPDGGVGPDVIVASIFDLRTYGGQNGRHAFAIGTNACNIGDSPVAWVLDTNEHPVIAQNMYRLQGGRFEMVGLSWVKHGFAAANEEYCSTCQITGPSSLGVGCSDPYDATTNGAQIVLGPRSEVNAFTGVFPYPYGGPSANGFLDKRIQVQNDDLNPALNPGARYFVEGHYVTADDAQAGNGLNNASYREIVVNGAEPDYSISFAPGAATQPTAPALFAWKAADPQVSISTIDIPGEGRLYLGVRVTDLGQGTWHYEYALLNYNSDRAVRAFGVPVPGGVTLSNLDRRIPAHHSGEPYVNYNWKTGVKLGHRYWATKPFDQDLHANALRWSTMATFRFDADSAPTVVDCGVELFKPGQPKRFFFPGAGPQ